MNHAWPLTRAQENYVHTYRRKMPPTSTSTCVLSHEDKPLTLSGRLHLMMAIVANLAEVLNSR